MGNLSFCENNTVLVKLLCFACLLFNTLCVHAPFLRDETLELSELELLKSRLFVPLVILDENSPIFVRRFSIQKDAKTLEKDAQRVAITIKSAEDRWDLLSVARNWLKSKQQVVPQDFELLNRLEEAERREAREAMAVFRNAVSSRRLAEVKRRLERNWRQEAQCLCDFFWPCRLMNGVSFTPTLDRLVCEVLKKLREWAYKDAENLQDPDENKEKDVAVWAAQLLNKFLPEDNKDNVDAFCNDCGILFSNYYLFHFYLKIIFLCRDITVPFMVEKGIDLAESFYNVVMLSIFDCSNESLALYQKWFKVNIHNQVSNSSLSEEELLGHFSNAVYIMTEKILKEFMCKVHF